MTKFLASSFLCISCAISSFGADAGPLRFDPENYRLDSITMPQGNIVEFKAYEGIFYVSNVEDSAYQCLNIYVPVDLKGRKDKDIPVFMRNNVGGYMASPAGRPSATDASGRALAEGYVLCIPGARGNGSAIVRDGKTVLTGTAPNGLLDLKAAVRYLRYNDALIPGNSEKIFTDGTSAGGAMSSLLGATGDAPEYEPYLTAMGAAKASDAVYASICYCPITDLEHADMEYEWLYGCTNTGVRNLDEAQSAVSGELASLCAAYINSLNLRDVEGAAVTAANYMDFLKTFIMSSAQKAIDEGCEIPDNIGIIRYQKQGPSSGRNPGMGQRGGEQRGGMQPRGDKAPRNMAMRAGYSDFVIDVDMEKYLSYVASQQSLKTPPAFDSYGVLADNATPENTVFGDEEGNPANFTSYSLSRHTGKADAAISAEMAKRVMLMNPMNFIGTEKQANVAGHWYIRHGAKDRDTSFLVPVNLATQLRNAGFSVDFALAWNRPHTGDYNLDDLFHWIESVK